MQLNLMIAQTCHKAMQAVNTTLVQRFWQMSSAISQMIASAEWGDGMVVAVHLSD